MARNKKEEKKFIPSKYQTAIFDFVKNGNGNAVIEAVAGSGKTSTALKCIELMGSDEKILLTAFNTDIVDELKQRIKGLPNKDNIDCRTMHSLGYMILMSNFPKQIESKPNDFKYAGYIYNNVRSLSNGSYSRLSNKDRAKYIENVKKFVDFGRFYLCDSVKDLDFIEKHYNVPVFDDEKEVAIQVMEWGKNNIGTIDFTDMVWLPNVLNCKPYGRIYDWIICDECQDTMTAERMLLLRCTKMSTRMLFFGEKIQCQPEGTMVLMSDGTKKDIKDVRPGDELVSYNIKKSTYSGYKTKITENKGVVETVESHVDKRFVKVTTINGIITEYTPEHTCLAKFNFGKHPKTWAVALMENNMGMFFIGKAVLYSDGIHHGLLKTLRNEHCTKGWLLHIHFNETEASLNQIRMSQVYNIPMAPSLLFGDTKDDMVKNNLGRLYEEMGPTVIMTNAIKCLEDHHRILQFPISDAYNEISHARTRLHTVKACNLVPEIMELSYFSENNKSQKIKDSYKYAGTRIKSIEYTNDEKRVYSLSVSRSHTYVADGVATHNCIYSFMGSDYRSFDELRKLPNTVSLPLSISYRCAQDVVNYAKRFNKQIEAKPDAPKGMVKFGAKIDEIQDGDMVLCRVNAPLLQLYCKLVEQGKAASIRGKDVGASLIRTIKKTNEDLLNRNLSAVGVFSKLYDKLLDEIDTVMNKHHITLDMAMDDSGISQMYDTIQALEAISEDIFTTNQLIDKINNLFKDKKIKGISLSTIHKAKGLESDNVFICCPSLSPSKSAKEDWEKEQEYNLEYVAYTRAKQNLYFLEEEGFDRYSSNSQQKASEIERIKRKVFMLHGNSDRCHLSTPSPEAAKHIISNATVIQPTTGKVIDLNRKKKISDNTQIILPRRPKKRKR